MLSTAGSDYENQSVQREHLHIMCLHYFSWECVAYLCATSLHGCMCMLVEGSLEAKLPTIWTDEKQSRAEAERRERLEERRSEEKESEERRCRCAKR